MTAFDVFRSMGNRWRRTDDLLERVPDGLDPSDDLAVFFASLDRTFPAESPISKDAHVAAMMAAQAPPAATTSVIVAPTRIPLRYRFRVLVASVTAFGTVGGMAAAGVLPGPIQGAIADAAARIGIHLPDGRGDDEPTERAPLLELDDDSRERDDAEDRADDLEDRREEEADEREDRREDRKDEHEDQLEDQRDEAEDREDEAEDRQEEVREREEESREREKDRAEDRADEEADRLEEEREEAEDREERERERAEEQEEERLEKEADPADD